MSAPSWSELAQRLAWLAYGWIRTQRKALRRWRVARRQAKRPAPTPFPRWEPGAIVEITDYNNRPSGIQWGGNQLYFDTTNPYAQLIGHGQGLAGSSLERAHYAAQASAQQEAMRQLAYEEARRTWEADQLRNQIPPS